MLKSLNEKKIEYLVFGAFLFLPIKLSFALAFILPLITIYILRDFKFNDLFKDEYKYLTYFFILAFMVSFCCLTSFKSLPSLISFYFYTLLIPATIRYTKKSRIIFLISLLALGQTISSFHTILQEALGENIIREFFVGKLSESGQLALTLPLVLGVILFKKDEVKTKLSLSTILYFVLYLTLGVSLGFSSIFSNKANIILLVLFLIFSLIAIYILFKSRDISNIKNFLMLYMPIMMSSFILNLKRGPWIGVGVVCLILLLKFNRKIIVPLILSCLVLSFAISPIRERILSSESHFFISGGRASIWKVASELMTRYPLGVGYKNSRNLSAYSVDIPANLKHFHNNFLNILVEFGIFNLFLFLMWLFFLLKKAIKGDSLAYILGLSLLSSQLAGLVEYNVGDSEVFLVFLLIASLVNVLGEDQ